MIYVTKPFLPPQEEYEKYLDGIWKREWLTNNGPLVNDLELKLKDHLGLPHFLYMSNGTIAIQIAIKALGLSGEIITTPFTYVATTSSIVWEGCKPVFIDIDPETLNMDPRRIEAAITPNTTAIVATHVYGNPCDIDAIDAIARKHRLRVIYDAAHCFGSTYRGKSVYGYGDVSTASFHATKLYHTIEGGGVFTQDPDLLKKMAFMRNFGHFGPENFAEVGINGKNSEFHAAMGLCNLRYIAEILRSRREQSELYSLRLRNSGLGRIKINPDGGFNYAYYPVICSSEEQLLRLVSQLEGNKIMPRRYFFPSLNTVSPFQTTPLEITDSISRRVLCLPLYHDLTTEEIEFICRIVLRTINNG